MGIYVFFRVPRGLESYDGFEKLHKINDCTHPKFIKRHKCRNPRSSVILRGDKPKKVYTQIHQTFGFLKSKFREKSLEQYESLSGGTVIRSRRTEIPIFI